MQKADNFIRTHTNLIGYFVSIKPVWNVGMYYSKYKSELLFGLENSLNTNLKDKKSPITPHEYLTFNMYWVNWLNQILAQITF